MLGCRAGKVRPGRVFTHSFLGYQWELGFYAGDLLYRWELGSYSEDLLYT